MSRNLGDTDLRRLRCRLPQTVCIGQRSFKSKTKYQKSKTHIINVKIERQPLPSFRLCHNRCSKVKVDSRFRGNDSYEYVIPAKAGIQ